MRRVTQVLGGVRMNRIAIALLFVLLSLQAFTVLSQSGQTITDTVESKLFACRASFVRCLTISTG